VDSDKSREQRAERVRVRAGVRNKEHDKDLIVETEN
jgi:hypothetical protein